MKNKPRRYFKCPVQVLYMMREFCVEFNGWHERHGEYAVNQEDIIKNFHKYIEEPLYVDPESESIFEPKEYDLGVAMREDGMGTTGIYSVNHKCWTNGNFRISPAYHPRIIMRDSIQFFSGELEND